MHQARITTHDQSARVTSVYWDDAMLDRQPRFAEVAMALLPASLILATATALLVAII